MNELERLLRALGGDARPVASHASTQRKATPARPAPAPLSILPPPPPASTAALPRERPTEWGPEPFSQKAIRHGVDAILGAIGVRDPLAPEATPATGVGAIASMLSPLAVMGALKRVANPIRAYHGSPHDFDRFKLSQIGTGEGAQAYGHGLYFAESPEVARSYQRTLTRPGGPHGQNVTQANLRAEYEAAGNWPDAVEAAVRRYYAPPKQKEAYRQMLLREGPPPPPDGRMYEVNIHASPDDFLDWDKPLSQQPENVRKALGGMTATSPEQRLRLFLDSDYAKQFPNASDVKRAKGVLTDPDFYGTPAEWAAKQTDTTSAAWNLHRGGDSGAAVYQLLVQKHMQANPGVSTKQAEALASNELKGLGIPGIRYLDQGSRAGGKGTSNYSMWDEDVIEILRKYGILPPLGAVAAHQIQQDRP